MIRSLLKPLLVAVAFLTRLPIRTGPVLDRDLGRSVAFFPLVGLLLGLVVTGVAYGLSGRLPSMMIAVVVVALHATLTSALHLDGLGDLFDGLAGGRGDRDRTLAIMRDGRVGAKGAVALILVLLAKVAAVDALLEARGAREGQGLLALVAFPAVARWAVTPQIALFPYARLEGLGRAFAGEAGIKEVALATAGVVVLAVVLGPVVAKQAGAALIVSVAIAVWLRARLGGLTGDIYGATIELGETAALFAVSMQ
jgi:adenosylcobinamide-GDP ribazoletransferase